MRKGLVISGGGARGLFTIQILRRMLADKFDFSEIKAISGGSVGSIIGAMIAQGDINLVIELFDNIRNKDVYKGKLSLARVAWALATGKNYILDIEPLYATLSKYISLQKALSGIPFSFGLVDMATGAYRTFYPQDFYTNEDYIRAIMASCSQEVIWQPQSFRTKTETIQYGADGGIVTVSPIGAVISNEIDQIIIINNTPSHIGYTSKLNNLGLVAMRMLDILLNSSFNKDLDKFVERNAAALAGDKRYLYVPSFRYQTTLQDDGLDFDTEEVRKARIKDANMVYSWK